MSFPITQKRKKERKNFPTVPPVHTNTEPWLKACVKWINGGVAGAIAISQLQGP